MTVWAHVVDGELVGVGPFPGDLDNLVSTDDDGNVTPVVLTDAEKIALEEQAGFFRITETPRPADTPSTTWVRSVQLVSGTWSEVWSSVPKSAEQIANETADANEQAMRAALMQSLGELRTLRQTTGNLSSANLSNGLRAVARAQIRLIRVVVQALDAAE